MKCLKFLIIDDEVVDRAYYQRLLKQAINIPFEYYETVCAKDALKILERKKIDCILLDYQLPDINGIELLKKLKKICGKFTPIIMLTGQGNESIAVNAMKEGATDYLIKNQIEPTILINLIMGAIRNSQLRKIIYKQKKLLKNYSFHDRLTGLLSRHTFEVMATRALIDAKRFHYSLAIIIIDLDNFMVINDSLGHLAGTALLIEVSQKMNEVLSRDAIIARLKNDKFAVLLTGNNLVSACETAALKLIEKIGEPYQLSIDTAYISTSIGISIYPDCGDDLVELLKKAHIALSRAKELGGGCFLFYSDK